MFSLDDPLTASIITEANPIDQSNIPQKEPRGPNEQYCAMRTEVAICIAGHIDSGKCFCRGTQVMKYDGSLINVEDIKVGDKLMGDDSTARIVLETHSGEGQLYKITPIKGDSYTVNGEHILCLKYSNQEHVYYNKSRNRYGAKYVTFENGLPQAKYKFFNVKNFPSKELAKLEAERFLENDIQNRLKDGDPVELSVIDFLKLKKGMKPILKWYRTGVDFLHKDVPFDPYMFGFWLGDGASAAPEFTNVDQGTIDYSKDLPQYGLELYNTGPIRYSIRQIDSKRPYGNKMGDFLRENNLLGNKHIPNIYKYNSRDNRLKLLAGIIDSDGYYKIEGNEFEISMSKKYPELVDDIIYLIRSLGFATCKRETIKVCTNGKDGPVECECYSFNFGGIGQEDIPSLFGREAPKPGVTVKSNMVTSITISKDKIGTYYGFGIDGNQKFLLGDFSVAHNSTFIGVMKYNELDDGNGSARIKVAKHPHEKNSGKTSDISTRLIPCDDGEHGVTFVDLCGHEKYLKTTTYGINGYFPDYSFTIVSANRGVMKMTREHLGILFYLEIPTFILITRVDLVAGSNIYRDTLNIITQLCKRNKKQVIVLNSDKEFSLPGDELIQKEQEASKAIIKLAEAMQRSPNIVPILTISCKTGYFLNTVRSFINNIKPRKLWSAESMEGSIFYIDQVFNPVGIGIVISGIVKGKTIKINDILHIGPNGKEFTAVKVKSIHNDNREDLLELDDHQRGCLAISCIDKKVDFNKSYIKKGMIAVYPKSYTSKICYRFKAQVDILHHSATINSGYSPFIHAGPICQTAKLTIIEVLKKDDNEDNDKEKGNDSEGNKEKKSLRTGDSAIVNFKFKFKPEFIETFAETGKYFFFREGTTRGRGKILEIVKVADDPDPTPDPIKTKKKKMRVRGGRPPSDGRTRKLRGQKY